MRIIYRGKSSRRIITKIRVQGPDINMAVPFLYLVLSFIFFLPNICCSCRRSLCGNITIEYPFSLNHTTSPNSPPPSNGLPMVPLQHVDDCDGFLTINCNQGQATITIQGHEFVVMDIAYSNGVITIQDIALGHYHFHIPCAFFVNFTHPIYGYDLFNYSQVEGFRNSPQDCELGFGISQTLSAEPFSLTECEDYHLYYWNELNQHDVNESCKTDQPAFEWKLSYKELKGRFFPLSVGFSQHFQLREDCFNCQVHGKSCTSNKGAVNSSCWGETTCESKDQLPLKKSTNKREIIGIVGGVAGGFILLGILVIFCYKRKKRYLQSGLSGLLSWSSSSKKSSKKDVEVGESNYHTHIFSYDELEEATSGFNASEELGDGGFGTVYKGKLRDGRTVAVKRLYEHNYRRLEQFMNEVEILSRLRHQNLVTLYGCTSRHSRELLLVYEYIPNGTVADHLHGSLASKASLTWPIRLSIAIETADALAYLHHAEPQIIHRDVKTNNILLDNHHHVKVADFGLSRLFPLDATHVSTAPQGTPGYVDPEYHQCYQLTDKSDVYSFGVVLIELISSKPAVDISRHRHEINLANLAVNKIQNCQLDQLVDTNLGYDVDLEVKRMIDQVAELAFRCLQSDGEMRPGIREVLEMLKVIGNGGYNEEGEGDGSEVMTTEESTFVKSGVPVSPDTVTGRWASRTSTPNTST